jgi:cytosine/adenosine deaminase-related metal-dependent hydrolase
MLITNAKLITWERPNRVLEDHALLLHGDRIQELGPQADLLSRHPLEERLDAGGQYVMPSRR